MCRPERQWPWSRIRRWKKHLDDLIMGYYFASDGKILLDGQEIEKFDLEFLRSKIAVVPQDIVLFNDTIRANVMYGNFDATDEELQRAAEQSHCLEFIEQFSAKWEQVVGERGLILSAGQKQRVAIARALLKKSSILILDEPTSALDAKSEEVIQQALNQLTHDKTTFIVAHRLSTVRNADKIIVLEDGRVVEMGRHEKLIRMIGGTYRWLYEHQLGLHD